MMLSFQESLALKTYPIPHSKKSKQTHKIFYTELEEFETLERNTT
jgi:hypothetical protein